MSDEQETLFPPPTVPAWQRSSYPLYDGTPPHEAAPTSHAAAEEIRPATNKLQERVLAFLITRGPGGATDEEIQDGLEMNPSTARPRRRELELLGKIVHDGTRPTRSGRAAKVWVAVAGRA